jgi:NTE family protein
VRVHMISDDALMNELSAATKLTPSPQLTARLKAAGRGAAEVFLANHAAQVGQAPSVDLAGVLR